MWPNRLVRGHSTTTTIVDGSNSLRAVVERPGMSGIAVTVSVVHKKIWLGILFFVVAFKCLLHPVQLRYPLQPILVANKLSLDRFSINSLDLDLLLIVSHSIQLKVES